MKISLIALNAKFSHTQLALRQMREYVLSQRPNLCLEIELLEFNINQNLDQILPRIYNSHADLYLCSVYIWNYSFFRDLLPQLRLIAPQALIGLGGPEVSFTAEAELASLDAIDLVLCGEGEASLLALAELAVHPDSAVLGFKEALKRHASTVPGLVLRGLSASLPQQVAMDELPFPYRESAEELKNRLVYYETSRGCPFNCSYCLSSREEGLREKSLDLVFADLERFRAYAVPVVKLCDRSFNAKPERARAIWQYLIASAGSTPTTCFHCEIEANLLGEADFELLAQAPPGLLQFEIGIQSFNPSVLKTVRRSPDSFRVSRAIQRLAQTGNIHLHADLIFGLPGEDFDSCLKSFDLALECGAEQIQLGFLKLLKGTDLAKSAANYGLIGMSIPPYEVLRSHDLSFDEFQKLKCLESIFERLYNSGRFSKTLKALGQYFVRPSELYLELSEFFGAEGFFDRPFAEDNLYALLAHYSLKRGFQVAYQAVTEDYYSRSLKGRLEFERILERYPTRQVE